MSEAELFTTRYRIRWSFHICEQTWRQLASESAWRLSPLSCKPVSPATGPWTAVLKWPDGAVALSLRFRIQEMRLQLWGRSAGVNFEDDQHNGQDGDQKDKQLSPGSGILEILPMRELVMDVLGRILEVLDRHMEIKRKYNTLRAEPFENPPSPTPSSAMHIRGALQQKVKEVSRKTSLTGKIRWGLKDKGSLDVLLEELTALNDGLENLLIRRDVSLLSQCLMGEIVDESRPLALGQADPQAFGVAGQKAAMVVSLRQQRDSDVLNSPSPFSDISCSREDIPSDPLIDTASLEDPDNVFQYGLWETH